MILLLLLLFLSKLLISALNVRRGKDCDCLTFEASLPAIFSTALGNSNNDEVCNLVYRLKDSVNITFEIVDVFINSVFLCSCRSLNGWQVKIRKKHLKIIISSKSTFFRDTKGTSLSGVWICRGFFKLNSFRLISKNLPSFKQFLCE